MSDTPRPSGIAPTGFRLPSSAHVGKVRLLVSDLERSIEYYQQVVGLHIHDRASDRASLGSPEVPLVVLQTGATQPARRGALGLYHFALLLPHRAALGQFLAHLTRMRIRVGMADHLVSEAIYLTDPDGLGIEVYADRPQREWRHRGQELQMSVDPLDVESLMDAGGTADWKGTPAGTVIGHVHLHVGSLSEAEAFYHHGLGFDKTLWTFPGALFLAAGGYHHHLGTNTWGDGSPPGERSARLLEWEVVVPGSQDVAAVAQNLRARGYEADAGDRVSIPDPWGTSVRILPAATA